MSDWDDEPQAPICGCGVTALPAEGGGGYVCENPDCESFGEPV